MEERDEGGMEGGEEVGSLAASCLAMCQPLFVSQANISKTHGGQELLAIHHAVALLFIFSARDLPSTTSIKSQSYKMFDLFPYWLLTKQLL